MKKYELEGICVVLVLYNINYKDSLSLSKLLIKNKIKIYVCDNSTKDYGNIELEKYSNVKYINMGGNKGLAKAYNKAVNIIPHDKLIILLDDDSVLPENFFDSILDEVSKTNADIYIPIVEDGNGILSPCKNRNNCFFRYNDIHEIDNDFSAINSGLVIKSKVFEDYRYDENMFLDYIDHAFFNDMKKKKKKFKIMYRVKIRQNFSLNTDTKESSIIRLKILKKDLKYFYRNQKRYYYWTVFKKKIHLCLIHKSIKFIFI